LARVIRTNFDFLLEEQPSPVVILWEPDQEEQEILNKLKETSQNIDQEQIEENINLLTNKQQTVSQTDDDIEIIEIKQNDTNVNNNNDILNFLSDTTSKPQKVRPFDPCPCWSWKPYIKCCWKKKK
jgi:uncharacterized protein YchJ